MNEYVRFERMRWIYFFFIFFSFLFSFRLDLEIESRNRKFRQGRFRRLRRCSRPFRKNVGRIIYRRNRVRHPRVPRIPIYFERNDRNAKELPFSPITFRLSIRTRIPRTRIAQSMGGRGVSGTRVALAPSCLRQRLARRLSFFLILPTDNNDYFLNVLDAF